jgi:hypothetical protein
MVSMKVLLKQVNKARVALGLTMLQRLPKGHQGSLSLCPLAVAMGKKCTVDEGVLEFRNEDYARKVAGAWHVSRNARVLDTPRNMARFVEDFDSGEYPELVL